MKLRKGSVFRRRARRAALFDFLKAGMPTDMSQSLARHPELLDEETDALIGELLMQARKAGRIDIAEGLEELRGLLARERVRARDGEHAGELPVPVREAIAELRELTGSEHLDRRIELLRRVLADPAVRSHLWVGAALNGLLGADLVERCDRLGLSDYAEAISALKVAFDAPPGVPAYGSRRKAALDLGRIYARQATRNRQDNVEAAITYLTEALQPGNDQPPPRVTAEAQVDLADAYLKRATGPRADNVRVAIMHLEAADQFFIREAQSHERAALRGILGVAYLDHVDDDRAQNIERAVDYLTEAYQHFASRGPAPACAAAAQNLANAYIERRAGKPADNTQMAIDLLESALGVLTEQEYPLDRAVAAHSLGNAYLRRGHGERADNVEQAIAFYIAARDTFARLRVGLEEALTRYSLAAAYFQRVLGDHEDNAELAIPNLEAAEAVFRALGMIEERAAALTGLGIAVSVQAAGGPGVAADLAIGYHKAALRALGERDAWPGVWAMIQNNLGTVYLERDGPRRHEDLSSAIACFTDALACGAEVRRSPLDQAMTRHNLGNAYAERAHHGQGDDLRRAIDHLKGALESFADAGLPVYQRATGQSLGDAYARLGDWNEALAAYEGALAAADALYVMSFSRSARRAELAETPALHRNAAYAAAKAGQRKRAAVIAERGRARSLGDARARDQAELGKISNDLANEFRAAAERLQKLEAAEWLAPAIMPVPGTVAAAPHRTSSQGFRESLGEARRLLADAISRIRLDGHPAFLAEPEFADIAAVVCQAGPLAYLAACAEGSLTLLVTQSEDVSPAGGQPEVRVDAVPEHAEPLTASALRTLVIGSGSADRYLPAQMEMPESAQSFEQALAALLPVLGERLTGPLADQLACRQADRVTLVACGLLSLLPLHAASYQRGPEIRCLLSDYAVTYTPSARVLGSSHSALAAQQKRTPALAGVASSAGGGTLEFAEAELRAISGWFPPDGSRVFSEAKATRSNLLAAAAGATHIHFACHGIFDAVSPADSALLLSNDGQPDPLTLRDIMVSRPFSHARLVVASACQTTLTDFMDAPDEAVGLPAGFLNAGTPGMVGTLWTVSDDSTALLMCRFYELHLGRAPDQLTPLSPAEALRKAQLWLAQLTTGQLSNYYVQDEELHIRVLRSPAESYTEGSSEAAASSSERPFAHPYHWASSVFVGA